MSNTHETYMRAALELAREAADDGEVPVGAVVVQNGLIIGKGRNRRESNKNALAHAEIEAINQACEKLGGWRLCNCTMYVTMEPCPMCGGAIINSRIDEVYFSVKDNKAGVFGSLINYNNYPFNHKVKISGGICQSESESLLREFFMKLRRKQ